MSRYNITELQRYEEDLDTSKIREWRSIVTLIVFIGTSELRLIHKSLKSLIPLH